MKILNTTPVLGRLFIAFILAFMSCTPVIENSLQAPLINKPFKLLDVKPNQYAIKADKDTVIKTESGTRIRILANSMVDASNKPVTGEVVLEYREFQTPTDILVSGIPMTVDSGGAKYGFESAGMFDISASDANGNAVYIKNGSAVNVQLATFRESDDYTFYYLDTVSQKWQTLGSINAAAKNTGKEKQIDSLNRELASVAEKQENVYKPKKYKPGDKILNLDIDYSKVPELRPFHALIWRYAGRGGKDDPEANTWIYQEKWVKVGLEASASEKGKYVLKLGNKTKLFTTIVEPVLQGKDLEKAERELNTQLAEYNKIMTVYKNAILRQEREANMLRSFTVAKFGIYNCDRILNDENVVRIMADFRFDKTIPGAENATVYLVIESRNAVISYYSKENETITFVPNENNKLIAVMPDESIAILGTDDFISVSKDAKSGQEQKLVFTLKVTDKKMKVNQDITNLLASI
jgi:hypothetical protein